MAEDRYNDLIGKKFIGLSILLTGLFWAVFTWLLIPFVPAETPTLQYVFSGYTSACLTGVFFLALHMFRVVKVEHSNARRSS